jgi:tyrosyl-tRNA synthetase
VLEGNALIEYSRYIIFRKMKSLRIDRPAKYGGDVEFFASSELEAAYGEGTLHPADLKKGVGEALDEIIAPIRKHFVRDPSARKLFELVKEAETTR